MPFSEDRLAEALKARREIVDINMEIENRKNVLKAAEGRLSKAIEDFIGATRVSKGSIFAIEGEGLFKILHTAYRFDLVKVSDNWQTFKATRGV